MPQFAHSGARAHRFSLAASWVISAVTLSIAVSPARGQAGFQVVTDKISYNVGETVRVRVIPSPGEETRPLTDVDVTVRYLGDSKPVLEATRIKLGADRANADEYREVWRIPEQARTGRYMVVLAGAGPKPLQPSLAPAGNTAFVVHKKLVRIERIELDKTFYSPGDPVSCRAILRNLTTRPLTGLRVEFSERYWPWIAQQVSGVGTDVFPIVKSLTLRPGIETEVRSARAAIVKPVQQPAVKQYAVVVWDEARKNVYDIAFSALTFVQPVNNRVQEIYPNQYVHPSLESIDTTSYREFRRPEFGSTAIQFDGAHTMYEPGEEARVKFAVTNSTDRPWHAMKIQASLRALGSAEFGKQVVSEGIDLKSHGRIEQEVTFRLPSDKSGTYRVVVEVTSKADELLAAGQLELAANPLPDSILLFCAHEDDDTTLAWIIRAAAENRVPIHVVYFTGGDAGSCDRYYQHSCDPEEAMNFGALRMEEARASLGHLGVPRESVHFLGLPDGGSGEIWYRHHDASNPYLSVLLASDHAPYDGLETPNLPYARNPVVEATKEMIKRFQPQVVITAHPPAEGHIDHIVNNFFVVKALQELAREAPLAPGFELWVNRVYDPKGHPSTPYHYEERSFSVTGEVAARAQEAGWYYQSQTGNRAQGHVRTMSELPRTQSYRVVLDWKEHEGWNEKD
ncbi:MAG: PIG-L family deacetylase [Terriglobia bacterium]